ncbi:imidazolonepropionase [Nakamurella flavida]|uniref:Imidazolonepropionase n=1 Tax=Nakamurella flavida TaxID=363630 RepID=A0A938YPB6_9ACTN|nr:imidazolonepropionase [Nakamurella flavida]MBM9477027.1 imidazolonepropionase [Nakamurella flavida]MDP9779972.1 imidazolonepropionase [Nakamurella flavida]
MTVPVPTAQGDSTTGSTLIHGISELVTNDPAMGEGLLGLIPDAAVIIDGDRIAWVGSAATAPAADTVVDLEGRAVLPGWVDSHSHVVFAGDRAAEFSARLAGAPYSAAGIGVTVEATRAAPQEQLVDQARSLVAEMVAGGTTCIETKTGYGLDVRTEVRIAQAAGQAGVDEVTFLGAHAVPAEFDIDVDGYLDLVCGPMLDAVRPYVGWIDVFCEIGAFDEARARRVLAAGQRHGLGLRVHGNQLGQGPGVSLAVDLGAASVDHCTYLEPADIDALAGSQTVATLLPICDLSTRQPVARGRDLVDAGVSIALATNCNPGSSYSSSMSLAVGLGVLQSRLTPAEAIHAATAGGARALRRTDVGVVMVGARADLHALNAPAHDYVAYRIGTPLTNAVWRRGQRVV